MQLVHLTRYACLSSRKYNKKFHGQNLFFSPFYKIAGWCMCTTETLKKDYRGVPVGEKHAKCKAEDAESDNPFR